VIELGRAALALCLGLAVYATVAGSLGASRRKRRLVVSADNALIGAFAASCVAFVVLLAAFLRRDFSFVYVAEHSSTTLPAPYSVSALWGGQEGSLLLWLVVAAAYAAAATVLARRTLGARIPWVTPAFGLVVGFFALVLTVVSTPFAEQLPPAEGLGLNPSLQNPYMMTHPIFLYLGYVGLMVPWAFAMGGLLANRTDEWWIVLTRRWTLLAWTFLGIGQLLGSKWAYEEIGWGGYYAWDPVENAALMPWLVATAFLHSVMVQEKKGMLRVWNVTLVSLAFALSIFGTFLTRSGVLNSIHSFARGAVGPALLVFLVLVVVISAALITWRLPSLRARTKLESLVSREATFLYNNLLLVALSLTILWGVIWPLVSELARGETRVVGAPYYNFFLRVLGLPLLLLMGIGPIIAWRRASTRALSRALIVPFTVAVAVGAALAALGAGSSLPGMVTYTFAAFTLTAIGLELWRGARAKRLASGSGWARSLGGLVASNRRRYGGYLVHVAVVLFAVGIAGSSSYQTIREGKLSPGESLAVRGYALTYRGAFERESENALERRAAIDVSDDQRQLGRLEPGKNAYSVEAFFSTEVAIRTNWLTGEDLFVVAEQFNEDGSVYLRAYVKPLVNLLWLGGLLFVFGSVVAMWPDAREQRRLAVRYSGGGVSRADPEAAVA
jgi:cytochrome c-type biogenesis protein CcmF